MNFRINTVYIKPPQIIWLNDIFAHRDNNAVLTKVQMCTQHFYHYCSKTHGYYS